MLVWWGDDLINDPYRSIVGGKHPEALGQPVRLVWREIRDLRSLEKMIAVAGTPGAPSSTV